jgi:hypothetical protein
MRLYAGCNLLVKIPFKYSKKDELTRLLESKLEGCKIKIEESETDQPHAEEATVSEGSQLSGLQVSKDWAPPSSPAPMVSDAGPYLLRAAQQAIQEFTENSDG